ncbi:MAG: hypothetical protein KC547_07905 [Anaerolineae bacterium]|nr:hypothetical protein [Anaerolineae bacterium]
MRSRDKTGAIIVIWGIVGGILLLFMALKMVSGGELTAFETLFGSAMMLAAGVASYGIANSGRVEESFPTSEHQSRLPKAKTSDMALADRLIDSMSEEEIAALRRRLTMDNSTHMGDDGELISLEEAMHTRHS